MDKKITAEDGKTKKNGATTQAATGTEQPAVDTTAPAETAANTTETVTANGNSPDTLAGYLSGGYYKGEGPERYTDPALVDQAEEIGKALAAGKVTPAAFNRLFRTLKAAEKISFPAQQGAMKKLLPLVTDLENHKKAPPLLRKVVDRNRAAVQGEADFAACLDHFKDIGIYLAAQAVSAGTPSK